METRRAIIAPQHPQYNGIVDLDGNLQVPACDPLDQFRSKRHTRDFGGQRVAARTRHRPAFLGKDPSLHAQHSGAGGTFPAACPVNTDYDMVIHSSTADIEGAVIFNTGTEVCRNTREDEI